MMGTVVIFVDPARLVRQHIDLEITTPNQIPSARAKIINCLDDKNHQPFHIRVNSDLFHRMRDFEGINGLEVMRPTARGLLQNIIGMSLPEWCSNDFILNAGLLDRFSEFKLFNDIQNQDAVDDLIINTVCPTLQAAAGLSDILHLSITHDVHIKHLLKSRRFVEHLTKVLLYQLSELDMQVLFDILRSDSRLVSIDAIISDSIHESIRTVVNETGVALPLPARSFSTKILAALAKLPFVITNITDTQIILNLTHRVIDKVRRNELSATALSKLLFAKSDAQMIALQEAIESTPSLATRELLDACRSLGWDGSKICEELLELHIEVGAPPVCSLDASAQSTMQWSKAYLEYALSMFSREKEPKEEISRSFQQWLITQPTRVASPNFNWRAVSSSVRKLLAENRRVLLIVVDAMGSLVAKELAETLRTNLRESNVNYRDLFGPLPTITENAKLAVATGIDKYKHPAGPTENKLFAAYGDILKSFDQVQVLKSWVSNELFILPNAKLILYLENQLDDKLHECIDFKSLQDQFRVVSEKVFNCINNALSLDGDLSVIITADHGLTSIQKTDTEHNYNSLGDVSDRLIKPVNSFVSAPEGFVEVRPEGAKDDRYFVVQARKRLTSSSFPFVHGGLTPEEVLIPLIIIEPVRKASISTRVQIHVGDSRVVMHGDSWQIPLRLVGGDDPANGLLIEAVSPFNGSYIQQHLNALAVANINLNVTSNVSQTGLVKLKLRLRYTDKSTHQVCLNDYCLTIEFPQPLLIRDQDVVDFNSMFE